MEIYNDLKNGYVLDGRGNRKEKRVEPISKKKAMELIEQGVELV